MKYGGCMVVLVGALAGQLQAGNFTTSYGIEFATIGDPGNRNFNIDEALLPNKLTIPTGGVGYEYRIATKELTVNQWHEFALAYAPYYDPDESVAVFENSFTSEELVFQPGKLSFEPSIFTPDPWDRAVRVGWEFAARYANWLHNGKVNEPWAFESGVYDTSTFTRNEDGSHNHQTEPSPGARYWIPNVDEWIKAAFYDPNRYGEGEGGYWTYTHGSNEEPIASEPGEGGSTNAGLGVRNGGFDQRLDVPGSYPHALSPWGLLDTSGNATEWASVFQGQGGLLLAGSSRLGGGPFFRDTVNRSVSGTGYQGLAGLRLASQIPSPGGIVVFVPMLFGVWRRR